jgi:hypothetical protein
MERRHYIPRVTWVPLSTMRRNALLPTFHQAVDAEPIILPA